MLGLGEIQETLLIPLYGRALDARRRTSVLHDEKAIELVEGIDYDFAKFRGPSLPGAALRASIFDEYVRAFLAEHPDGTVVDLGCGLSTRFERLDNGAVRWFDLDVSDVMALRRKFFADADRYTMITASIFDSDWFTVVGSHRGPVFLLSEAVLLYFPAEAVHAVLARLAGAFPNGKLALDTAGHTMIASQDRNPVFNSVRARMQWTCDQPRTLEAYSLTLRESRTFATPQRAVARAWPSRYRWGLKLAGWSSPVRTYKMNLFETRSPSRVQPHGAMLE